MVGLRKRKASRPLEDAEKRQRTEEASPDPQFYSEDEEDEEDEYKNEPDDFTDDGRTVDTPSTPFSPGRKKFPSELKTLKCTYPGCTKSFNRPIRLQTHLKIHTNERTFICTYENCEKSYFEDKHLQAHIKGSHTHERKHQCTWEDCTKSFLTATRLRRHIATHEGHERFRCKDYPPCKQTFRKHQTLQRHIRADHLELSPYPCKYIDPITNEACQAGFDGPSGLRRHEDTAHGAPQFFCANCVIPFAFNPDGSPLHPGFSTNTQLQSHIRKEHTNTTCIFCDKECSNERQLQIHIETKHSGATLEERKKVRCTYIGCDKTFTKTSNLNTHIRSAHMGERFICGEADVSETKGLSAFTPDAGCGKDFVSKQFLEDHIRIAHLGQKSLVNGKRAKNNIPVENDLDGFIDDGDVDGPRVRKKKPKKRGLTAVEKLTGERAGQPPPNAVSRPILRSEHQFPAPVLQDHDPLSGFEDFIVPWQSPMPDDGGNGLIPVEGAFDLSPLNPLDNIDWAIQQQALHGGPFWVGGGGGQHDMAGLDQWNHEEMEMRALIGNDYIEERREFEYPEL